MSVLESILDAREAARQNPRLLQLLFKSSASGLTGGELRELRDLFITAEYDDYRVQLFEHAAGEAVSAARISHDLPALEQSLCDAARRLEGQELGIRFEQVDLLKRSYGGNPSASDQFQNEAQNIRRRRSDEYDELRAACVEAEAAERPAREAWVRRRCAIAQLSQLLLNRPPSEISAILDSVLEVENV